MPFLHPTKFVLLHPHLVLELCDPPLVWISLNVQIVHSGGHYGGCSLGCFYRVTVQPGSAWGKGGLRGKRGMRCRFRPLDLARKDPLRRVFNLVISARARESKTASSKISLARTCTIIFLARSANLRVEILSSAHRPVGEMQAIMVVLVLPPRESCDRQGGWVVRSSSVKIEPNKKSTNSPVRAVSDASHGTARETSTARPRLRCSCLKELRCSCRARRGSC